MSFPLFVEKIEDLMLMDVLPTLIPEIGFFQHNIDIVGIKFLVISFLLVSDEPARSLLDRGPPEFSDRRIITLLL
jgi:hypothetical protein